jgi:hypothetical protein
MFARAMAHTWRWWGVGSSISVLRPWPRRHRHAEALGGGGAGGGEQETGPSVLRTYWAVVEGADSLPSSGSIRCCAQGHPAH